MAKQTLGFVALSSLKKPVAPGDPAEALAALRRIYFKTSPRTIDHDFAHAIELVKSISSERDREKASVFMEGINELRKEWEPKRATPPEGSNRRRRPPRKKR